MKQAGGKQQPWPCGMAPAAMHENDERKQYTSHIKRRFEVPKVTEAEALYGSARESRPDAIIWLGGFRSPGKPWFLK